MTFWYHALEAPASLHVTFQAMVKGYENPNLPVSLNPNATQSAESSSKSNRGVATQPHRIVPPTNDDGRWEMFRNLKLFPQRFRNFRFFYLWSFPEAKPDQEKLTNLQSNFNLMQFELNKICRKFRISVLNEKDLGWKSFVLFWHCLRKLRQMSRKWLKVFSVFQE